MAGVCENDDGDAAEGRDGGFPVHDAQGFGNGGFGVAFDEVREDEDDEVADGDEGDYAGVFEGVEAAEEGEGDDD